MGRAARVAGVVGFVLFVSVIAVRPLVANPAIAGVVRNGVSGWQLLAVAPLVIVTVLVMALRLRTLRDRQHGDDEDSYSVASAEGGESFWDARKADDGSEQPAEGGTDGMSGDDGQTPAANLLSGQGGTRERDFDIEEKPPDATLSDHLEHLQAELDDDGELARDLRTLEDLAEEVDGDRAIPERCPQDHCDAVWTGRTVLGVASGRYETLDDGTRVQCLECEEIHRLE